MTIPPRSPFSEFFSHSATWTALFLLALIIMIPAGDLHARDEVDFSVKIFGGAGVRDTLSGAHLFEAAPYVPFLINEGQYVFNGTGSAFFLEASQESRLRTEQAHARMLLEWIVDDGNHLGLELGFGYLETSHKCVQWCGEATQKAIELQLLQPGADQNRLLQDFLALQALDANPRYRAFSALFAQMGFNVYMNPDGLLNPYAGLSLQAGLCADGCFGMARASPVLGLQMRNGLILVDLRLEYGFESYSTTAGRSPRELPLPSALLGVGLRF